MKRILSLEKMKRILSLFIVLSMFIPFSAYARGNTFTDVSGDEYYAEAAKQLYNMGIISGYEDGSLGADRAVNRAEMATFVCRLLGAEYIAAEYKGTTTNLTQDVPENHWASGYVAYAVQKGIVNGDGNGKFRPDDKVSYREAVKMLVCAVGLEDEVTPVPGDWAQGYMNTALDAGILNNVLYDGGDYSNRSDVVMMLYNVITYVEFEKEYIPQPEDDRYEDADEKTEDEKVFEEWDQYDHYDENGNFITHELTVTMTGCGGIRNTGGKYPAGDNVPLYIYPGTESSFIRWTTTGGELSNPDGINCVITMPDEDVVVCAEFAEPGVVVRKYDPVDDWWYLIEDYDNRHEDDYYTENDFSDDSDDSYETNASNESFEDAVVRLVNEERRKHGLNSLIHDEFLADVAYAHSCDMRDRNFFSHDNPDGKSPFDRMDDYGIFYRIAAENIAKGQRTPEEVMNGWMNSPGHRANILLEGIKYIGVGICECDYGYIWTQCFTG